MVSYNKINITCIFWSFSYVEIDNEIISTVILLPSAESFKKGCEVGAVKPV